MSKKTLLNELTKELEEAEDLLKELIENDESETVRRVVLAIVSTYKQSIYLVNKHLRD